MTTDGIGVPDIISDSDKGAENELLKALRGYTVTQIAGALAELGLADVLTDHPRPAEVLAGDVRLDSDRVHRLLRAATSVGLVKEPSPRRFSATPMSDRLRTGVPGSLHGFARTVTSRGHWAVWGRLAEAVRTGQSQSESALGASLWGHYRAHPDEGHQFASMMSERTAMQASDIVATVDLSEHRHLVDIGGAHGALLAALLRADPRAHGTLFDRPEVVAGVEHHLGDPDLAGRCEIVGGDFFGAVPAGGDAYLLKLILHDWPDEDARRILRSVRAAIEPEGRLYVIELVLPPDGEPSIAHVLDLSMLVAFGGRERTLAEYGALLDDAGFRLHDVVNLSEADRHVLVASPNTNAPITGG